MIAMRFFESEWGARTAGLAGARRSAGTRLGRKLIASLSQAVQLAPGAYDISLSAAGVSQVEQTGDGVQLHFLAVVEEHNFSFELVDCAADEPPKIGMGLLLLKLRIDANMAIVGQIG